MANLDRLTERSVVFSGGGAGDTAVGGVDHDILEGGSGGDALSGGGGRDHVLGGSGNDVVDGGDGRDVVRGGSGNDVVSGGQGDDFLRGDTGDDHIMGGQGWDRLFGDEGNDFLEGGDGMDILIGGRGDDLLIGGGGKDHFVYLDDVGADVIHDFELDKDVIDLRLLPQAIGFSELSIADTEDGCVVRITHPVLQGSIELKGIAASNLSASNFAMPDGETTSITIGGAWITRPTDPFDGSSGSQLFMDDASAGNAFGNGGEDRIFGGEGDDRIDGGDSRDALYGEEGDDVLEGGYGFDRLFGGEGDDELSGGPGDYADLLVGGEGNDRLTGGAGGDRFVFGRDHGHDTIADFGNGADVIDLSGLRGISGFDDLHIGPNGNHTLIYLQSHGGGTIRLENFHLDDLDAADFAFYEPAGDSAPIDGM